jgi:uncharacterized metal-binding protein YceD (DUF177 family)
MADALDVRAAWSRPDAVVTLAEAQRGPVKRSLVADDQARARIAEALGLESLGRLEAEMQVRPWLDGVEISGRWSARVGQICGVTLEPFESELHGEMHLRALPEGSAALGGPDESGGELDLDPEADDPPDTLEGDRIDLAAYLVEDLSLAIDPFPRKPGVEFAAPEPKDELSPFAVLAKLKGGAPDA